jgi:uncharacterized SAM-binding protein YcdF (DUF218 family)
MIVLAYPPFSNLLVSGLENRYSKHVSADKVDYIHVLGSGHVVDDSQPLSSQISNSGLKRVVEGVVLHKKYPDSQIGDYHQKYRCRVYSDSVTYRFV